MIPGQNAGGKRKESWMSTSGRGRCGAEGREGSTLGRRRCVGDQPLSLTLVLTKGVEGDTGSSKWKLLPPAPPGPLLPLLALPGAPSRVPTPSRLCPGPYPGPFLTGRLSPQDSLQSPSSCQLSPLGLTASSQASSAPSSLQPERPTLLRRQHQKEVGRDAWVL